jgi:ferrous iron transport protein A
MRQAFRIALEIQIKDENLYGFRCLQTGFWRHRVPDLFEHLTSMNSINSDHSFTANSKSSMHLGSLSANEEACIVDVEGDDALAIRLLELGFVPGNHVRRTGQAPMGDPLEFSLGGARIGLRKNEACRILVTASNPQSFDIKTEEVAASGTYHRDPTRVPKT